MIIIGEKINGSIPAVAQGLGISTFPGVYEAVYAEIDKMSRELF